MARIAQLRADRPEIKQLADQILVSQDTQISQMRDWRGNWFGSRETPPMSQMPWLGMLPGTNASSQTTTMNMAADVQQYARPPSRST